MPCHVTNLTQNDKILYGPVLYLDDYAVCNAISTVKRNYLIIPGSHGIYAYHGASI